MKTVELTKEQVQTAWDSAEQWLNREKHMCEICGEAKAFHRVVELCEDMLEVYVCYNGKEKGDKK